MLQPTPKSDAFYPLYNKKKNKSATSFGKDLALGLFKNILEFTGVDTTKYFPLMTYSEHVANFKNAVDHNEISTVSAALDVHPSLVNEVLSSKLETALIIAAREGREALVDLLIARGANLDAKDRSTKKFTAIQHAEAKGHDAIVMKILDAKHHKEKILEEFQTLHAKIINEISLLTSGNHPANDNNETKLTILELAIEKINSIADEISYPDKLLDLYMTIKTIYFISLEADIKAKLNEFIAIREKVLAGDSHDYCFCFSHANHLVAQIAEYLYEENSNPANILFSQSLTENRSSAWENLSTAESDLPIKPGDYFRSAENFIYTYEGIVTRAITNLVAKYQKKQQIWFGDDPQNYKQPFTQADLDIIKQRSSRLKKLITYTEKLEQSLKLVEINVVERLSDLREGLKNGDAHQGEGTFNNTAAPGYIAIAEFSDWWSELKNSEEGRKIRKQIKQVNRGELGEVLEKLLNTAYGTVRIEWCTGLLGESLERILKSPIAFEEISAINGYIPFVAMGEPALKLQKAAIMSELKQRSNFTIRTDKNIFADLTKDRDFLSLLYKYDCVNYTYLLTMIDPNQARKFYPNLRLLAAKAMKQNSHDIMKHLLTKNMNFIYTSKELEHIKQFLQTDHNCDQTIIAALDKINKNLLLSPLSIFDPVITAKKGWLMNFRQKRKLENTMKQYHFDGNEQALWKQLKPEMRVLMKIWVTQGSQLIHPHFPLEGFLAITALVITARVFETSYDLELTSKIVNDLIFGLTKRSIIKDLKGKTSHHFVKPKEARLISIKDAKNLLFACQNATNKDELCEVISKQDKSSPYYKAKLEKHEQRLKRFTG